jgi:hypothetical protein
MTAAHASHEVRTTLLARGVPAALLGPLHAALEPALASGNAAAALPYRAMASHLRLLAAIAVPGDGDVLAGLARVPQLYDAALGLLQIPGTALRGRSLSPPRAEALAEARIAAMTLLANVAARKGGEDVWLSHPALLPVTVTCLSDATVGVRAAAAAALHVLAGATVRLKGALIQRGLAPAVTAASDATAALAAQLAGVPPPNVEPSAAAAYEAGALLTDAADRLREVAAMLA